MLLNYQYWIQCIKMRKFHKNNFNLMQTLSNLIIKKIFLNCFKSRRTVTASNAFLTYAQNFLKIFLSVFSENYSSA